MVILVSITNIQPFNAVILIIEISDRVIYVYKAICTKLLFIGMSIMTKAERKFQINIHSYSNTHTHTHPTIYLLTMCQALLSIYVFYI